MINPLFKRTTWNKAIQNNPKITYFLVTHPKKSQSYIFKKAKEHYFYFLEKPAFNWMTTPGWAYDRVTDNSSISKYSVNWKLFKGGGWKKRKIKEEDIFIEVL